MKLLLAALLIFSNAFGQQYGGMFGARINVNGYSKKGWDEKCGIIPQADRIAANDANLHFDINMVKLAPEFVSNRENKNAIRMIMVSHSGENTWSEVVRKAYETLDYTMLKRLMH